MVNVKLCSTHAKIKHINTSCPLLSREGKMGRIFLAAAAAAAVFRQEAVLKESAKIIIP